MVFCVKELGIPIEYLVRAVFEAIEKHARTEYGFASVLNVDKEKPNFKDEMPRYVNIIFIGFSSLVKAYSDLLQLFPRGNVSP